ncbi:MAG TPA: 3-dehydroquinate synthase [Vicinamibacteria bacterium]|nr:3-dehydroquinate synthase [Vicinamibacteria bacterium]
MAPPRSDAQELHDKSDPYPVLLGSGLIGEIGRLALVSWPRSRIAVVTQRRVARLHGGRLFSSLSRARLDVVPLFMPEGEERKNLKTVSALYDRLVSSRFTRDDAILAFGGGAVGDTAGFVAATFLRGIAFAQVPTTLLAQIDSAIGAKVGVNHPRGKNLIGTVYRPSAVWIDPGLLRTLPERDFRSGLFELLKYGFIGRPQLLRRMASKQLRVGDRALVDSIAEAVRQKLAVVREDEHERGLRRILNFGHTIGHGLEAASDYRKLTHGEAVGWGMIGAVGIGMRLGRLDPDLGRKLEGAVRNVGPLPPLRGLSKKRVLDAISRDKKTGSRGLRFVLPVGLGRVEVVDSFPLGEIARSLETLGVG